MILSKNNSLILFLFFLSAGASFAGEIASFEMDLGKVGVISLVKGKPEPETVGRFDKFVIKTKDSPKEKVVFETEGRILTSIQTVEISGGPSKDLLLTLDTGGSGGFVDFVLLSPASETYAPTWEEEAVKAGQVSVEDKDGDGKPEIVMKSVAMPEGEKEPVPQTEYFKYVGTGVMAIDFEPGKK